MASDLIYREDAKVFVRHACYKKINPIDYLDEVPAADVVEVVRCKDCRFYYKDSDGYEMCDNSEGYDHISADGFCAWAERRSDNGN